MFCTALLAGAFFAGSCANRIGEIAPPAKPPEMIVFEKLQKIMLPEVVFRDTPVCDALNAISEMSFRYDENAISDENRGIKIVPQFGTNISHTIPPVTLETRFVSLRETLDAVTIMSGLSYIVHGNEIWILPECATSKMEHRFFEIPVETLEKFVSSNAAKTEWKEFFEKSGVEFPDDAFVKLAFFSYNYPQNNECLERVLSGLQNPEPDEK